MSRTELERFCNEYLPAHPELKLEINARGDRQRLAKALVTAGKEAGFDFSEAEIHEVFNAELSDSELEAVAGGRKAGKEQHEYLIIKLNDVLITGVAPSGSGGS